MAMLKYDNLWQLLSMIDFKDQIPHEFHCIICKNVTIDPYTSLCGCRFCSFCIKEYLKNGCKPCPGGSNECLEHNLEIDVNITRDTLAIRSIIRLNLTCPNDMCQVKCNADTMGGHLRVCSMSSTQCPYECMGCQVGQISKNNLKIHYENEWLIHTQLLIEAIDNLKNEIDGLKNLIVKKDEQINNIKKNFEENEIMILEIKQQIEEQTNGIYLLTDKYDRKENELEVINEILKGKETHNNTIMKEMENLQRNNNKINVTILEMKQQIEKQRKEIYLLTDKYERNENELKVIKEVSKEKEVPLFVRQFCDGNIPNDGDNSDNICDVSIMEMTKDEIVKDNVDNNDFDKWKCGGCKDDKCSNCGNKNMNINKGKECNRITPNKVKSEKYEKIKKSRDKDCETCMIKCKRGEVKIGKDQWECCKCGLLQFFDFIECHACGASREVNGLWKCNGCTMINKCDNVRCGACDEENDYLRIRYCEYCENENVKNGKGVCEKCTIINKGSRKDGDVCNVVNEDKVKINKDQWQCYKCRLLQSFDFFECCTCGESREVNGLWKCRKCKGVNKCIDRTCKKCGFSNDRSKVKHIDVTNKNQLLNQELKITFKRDKIDHSKEWQCQNVSCHKWTKLDSEYCRECHLSRGHSRIPGEEVKQLKKGQAHPLWICGKCNAWNDLKNQNCSVISCCNPRFQK